MTERPDQGEVRRVVQDEMRGMGQMAPEPPISDPAPVGLTAFALTTFALSVVNAGFIADPNLIKYFVPLGLFYGGLVQLVAGFFEYRNRNVFGATAFNGYGAFWIALAILVQFAPQLGIPGPGSLSVVLGWTLLAWAIFTGIMLIASFGVSVAVAIVFALLFITYVLLFIAEFLNPEGPGMGLLHIGGYFGILTAIAAWYTAGAGVINHTYGQTILPVGERG